MPLNIPSCLRPDSRVQVADPGRTVDLACVPATASSMAVPCRSRHRPSLPLRPARHAPVVWLAAAMLLLFPAWATAWAQQETFPLVPEVVLGEIRALDLLAAEEAHFTFAVTEVGRYRLTPGILPPSRDVHVTVTTSDGTRLFANPMTTVDLTLLPGAYNLMFQAQDDATFDFTMVRHFGSYSVNPASVRVINPGHHLAPRQTEQSQLYARIQVPRQVEAQEWFIVLEHDSDTPLSLTLTGPDLVLEQQVQGTHRLNFWSAGNEYLLHLDLGATANAVSPALTFMHPGEQELIPIYLNSTVEGAMSLNRNSMHYRLTIDDGFVTAWNLTSDYSGDLDLSIHPLDQPHKTVTRSASPLPTESISDLLLVPDTYLITVARISGEGDALFALDLNVVPVSTYTHTPGEPTVAAQGEDNLLDLHGFRVEAPGQKVSLVLREPATTVEQVFVFGRQMATWDLLVPNRIDFVAPEAGPYFVGIRTLYGYGRYSLQITTDTILPQLPVTGVVAGRIDPGQQQQYRYAIPAEAGLISFVLVSLGAADLDLETNRYDPDDHRLAYKTSSIDNTVETVAWYDPGTGYIMVTVLSFGPQATEYLLVVRTQALEP